MVFKKNGTAVPSMLANEYTPARGPASMRSTVQSKCTVTEQRQCASYWKCSTHYIMKSRKKCSKARLQHIVKQMLTFVHNCFKAMFQVYPSMVWYGIVGFNVPLDTLLFGDNFMGLIIQPTQR